MSAESPFSPDWLPLLQDSTAISSFITGEQIDIAVSALLWYEYSLTVADEVRYVWRRSYNLSTLLYLLIRYTALLDSLLGVVYRVHGDAITDKSCEFYQDASTVLNFITCSAISCAICRLVLGPCRANSNQGHLVFVAARIMALWSCNWYLVAFLFVLGLLNPIALTQIPSFLLDAKAAPQPLPACMDDTSSYALVLISAVYLPTVSSAVNVAYELLCLALTVAQTYKTYKAYYCYTRLPYQLLRDGTLYFLSVTATYRELGFASILNFIPTSEWCLASR
ncbi:hypothetical protein BD413DRAFT_251444 [Trametes elegans]|nr:hypothetical protein BD413DRAFT_251444 [Trametes elegans]